MKGAWLQGTKTVIVQVETSKGGKGHQDAWLQVHNAVVLQEQRLQARGREGRQVLTPLKECPSNLGPPSTRWDAHTPFPPVNGTPGLQPHMVPTCVPGGIPGGTTGSCRAPHSTVVL